MFIFLTLFPVVLLLQFTDFQFYSTLTILSPLTWLPTSVCYPTSLTIKSPLLSIINIYCFRFHNRIFVHWLNFTSRPISLSLLLWFFSPTTYLVITPKTCTGPYCRTHCHRFAVTRKRDFRSHWCRSDYFSCGLVVSVPISHSTYRTVVPLTRPKSSWLFILSEYIFFKFVFTKSFLCLSNKYLTYTSSHVALGVDVNGFFPSLTFVL